METFLEKSGDLAVHTAIDVHEGFLIPAENLVDAIVSDYQILSLDDF